MTPIAQDDEFWQCIHVVNSNNLCLLEPVRVQTHLQPVFVVRAELQAATTKTGCLPWYGQWLRLWRVWHGSVYGSLSCLYASLWFSKFYYGSISCNYNWEWWQWCLFVSLQFKVHFVMVRYGSLWFITAQGNFWFCLLWLQWYWQWWKIVAMIKVIVTVMTVAIINVIVTAMTVAVIDVIVYFWIKK